MQLGALDHVNVRTNNLEAMEKWYQDVLGMTKGDRPNFAFPGAWLYVGRNAFVHLISVGDRPKDGDDLRLEHFAFSATGFEAFKKKLDATGERYEEREVPGVGITQINVWDPDGNHIHVDFRPADEAA